jgi:hypothetical protein
MPLKNTLIINGMGKKVKIAQDNPIVQWMMPFFNVHKIGVKKNVFIFSLPRSGSTWLMELIWSQPGFKYCNEPLNLKGKLISNKSGISGFEELYSDSVKDKLLNYFKEIVNGRFHFLDPNPFRKYYRFFTSRVVFKVIHGGEKFINDISDDCNGRVIYLLRHPIPVALSRKVLPRMDQLCSDYVLNHFTEEERVAAKALNETGTSMERRVLAWCLQNKLALMQRRKDWLVITYEQLTVDPAPVIEVLVKELELSIPERIYKHITIPSAVSVQSDSDSIGFMKVEGKEREVLIEKWKNKVKPEEALKLMEICNKFGMDIYSADKGMPSDKWVINSAGK